MKKLDRKNKIVVMALTVALIIPISLFVVNNYRCEEVLEEVELPGIMLSDEGLEVTDNVEGIEQRIYLEGKELDKYNLVDTTYLGSEVTTLENEEAIRFTFKYKNKSDKTITITPEIFIYSDEGGGTNYYDDEEMNRMVDGTEPFLKEKGITLEEFKKGYYDVYSKEFLEYTDVHLKPQEEVEITFTQKKSVILKNTFDKKDAKKLNKMNIKEIMDLEHMLLEYGYRYRLKEINKEFSFYYRKYPNSKLDINAYLDSYDW